MLQMNTVNNKKSADINFTAEEDVARRKGNKET
jgi:hypothetical protein